jgi:hypothetical protein
VSHRKTILLPGYAGRLGGRGDAIAGPVSWRRPANQTPSRRSRPRRVGRPLSAGRFAAVTVAAGRANTVVSRYCPGPAPLYRVVTNAKKVITMAAPDPGTS